MRTDLRKAFVSYRIESVSFHVERLAGATDPRILDTPRAVASLARDLIPDDGREHFGVLLLDAAPHLIGYHEVGVGSADQVVSSPRDIFGAALRVPGCVAIITVHNHPSGNVRPSKQDRLLTRHLMKAGTLLNIRLHDHVIVSHANDEHYSFDDEGALNP